MSDSDKFKSLQANVTDSGVSSETRVVKLEIDTTPRVEDYRPSKFIERGAADYKAIKSKFGPIAVTDSERRARAQKDSRFRVDSILRNTLSIEEEERRVIEQRVQERIKAVQNEAKEEAVAEGYKAGLKKGYDEAFAQFRAESGNSLKKLERFFDEAENAKHEIFRANERFLIDLIFRISKMVILKELSTDREYLLRLARDLIDKIGVRENITIRISPDDSASMSLLKEGLEKFFGTLKNLNIEISSQVSQGSCLIETQWNKVDAGIEQQLKGISDALVGQGGQKDSTESGS